MSTLSSDGFGMDSYRSLMEELKNRIRVVDDLGAGRVNLGFGAVEVELAYLQLRKILELIAYSSLVMNVDLYSKQRASFATDYHANRIIRQLAKINPNFYPEPMEVWLSASGDGTAILKKIGVDYLTVEDFMALYDKCSDIMHSASPYAEAYDYESFRAEIHMWCRKIYALLDTHLVNILGSDTVTVFEMAPKYGEIKNILSFQRL